MMYTKPLPRITELRQLAGKASFPATRRELMDDIGSEHTPATVQDFLALFPADETFTSAKDLLARTQELEVLLSDERDMPEEQLRSPQD